MSNICFQPGLDPHGVRGCQSVMELADFQLKCTRTWAASAAPLCLAVNLQRQA